MIVSLPKAKEYLRIDTDAEDDIVRKLLRSAEQLCMDVARLKADEFKAKPAGPLPKRLCYTQWAIYTSIGMMLTTRHLP